MPFKLSFFVHLRLRAEPNLVAGPPRDLGREQGRGGDAFERIWARLGTSYGPGWQQMIFGDGVKAGYKTQLTEWLVDENVEDSVGLREYKVKLKKAIVKAAHQQWLTLIRLDNRAAMRTALAVHRGLFLSTILGVDEFEVPYPKFDCILTKAGDWAKHVAI